MTTLGAMKSRIDRELRRNGTIDTEIADAISTAIAAYQDDRFHFNENRTNTFSTVANQEFYSSSDFAALARLVKIDYVTMLVGNTVFDLLSDIPVVMEGNSDNATSIGQPGWYVYYEQRIRLYPVPADIWTVRVAGVYRYAAPVDDDEASNFWMTDGERLIRSRAKYELATHVLRDLELAQIMTANTGEAFDQLKRRTNKLTQGSNGRVLPMMF